MSPTSSTQVKRGVHSFLMVLVLVLASLLTSYHLTSSSPPVVMAVVDAKNPSTGTLPAVQQQQQQQQQGYNSTSKVMFFHIHLAKTAGSSLNRYLARKYYTVCGNKGYSFDQPYELPLELRINKGQNNKRGYGPDRVHSMDMRARGYHNCKLISVEQPFHKSVKDISNLQEGLGYQVHTLVPCRDPVSHRISKCSHLGRPLTKWIKDDETTINDDIKLCNLIKENCTLEDDRYTQELVTGSNSISYFWYTDFSKIDQLIASHVPERSLQLPNASQPIVLNKKYPEEIVQEVVKRCGSYLHDYYMQQPLYKVCAEHIPQVDHIPYS